MGDLGCKPAALDWIGRLRRVQTGSQIAVAESGISAAQQSYERNLDRIREAQGLPIEAPQSVQALDQARRESLRAVTDYNDLVVQASFDVQDGEKKEISVA